jgi:GT2 family glycosyltransferase
VRSDVYHNMGGLDDDFFAHMEEIDFCWRIKNIGYKIKVNPASVVYHIGGGTLPKNNPKKTFLNFRNSLYLLIKNLPEERLKKTLYSDFSSIKWQHSPSSHKDISRISQPFIKPSSPSCAPTSSSRPSAAPCRNWPSKTATPNPW